MESSPQPGDRLTGKSTPPDEQAIRDWLGAKAFAHWAALQRWIDTTYPGVFTPDWLYGGKKRGWSLRYRQNKALCTLVPGYRSLSVLVVLGRNEREKFEERRYSWRPQLVKFYDESRTYHDGKWLTLPIATADDRQELMDLVSMKRPPLAG